MPGPPTNPLGRVRHWGRELGGRGGGGKRRGRGGGSYPGPRTSLGMHRGASWGMGLSTGAAAYGARSCLGHHEVWGNLVPQTSWCPTQLLILHMPKDGPAPRRSLCSPWGQQTESSSPLVLSCCLSPSPGLDPAWCVQASRTAGLRLTPTPCATACSSLTASEPAPASHPTARPGALGSASLEACLLVTTGQ